jgi:cytochrome c556
MKAKHALAAAAVVAAVLAGCQTIAAEPTAPDTVDVRQNMVEGVNPAALAIWDVGNNAADENGELDPAQMDAAAWAKVREAAQSLSTYAHRLATAKVIRASGPDLVDGKVPEGVSSREQIQAMIDANPAGFRAVAGTMEEQAKALASAAGERNLEKTSQLISGFDGTCQACHQSYWYLKP